MGSKYARFFLNDGTFIATRTKVGTDSKGKTTLIAHIYIDINGLKKPNMLGKDVFMYTYYIFNGTSSKRNGTFVPYGYKANMPREEIINPDGSPTWGCNKKGSGESCAALIMFDGWQMSEDYPW